MLQTTAAFKGACRDSPPPPSPPLSRYLEVGSSASRSRRSLCTYTSTTPSAPSRCNGIIFPVSCCPPISQILTVTCTPPASISTQVGRGGCWGGAQIEQKTWHGICFGCTVFSPTHCASRMVWCFANAYLVVLIALNTNLIQESASTAWRRNRSYTFMG